MKRILLCLSIALVLPSCALLRPSTVPYVPQRLLFEDLSYANENLSKTYQMVILRDATAYVYYQHGKPKLLLIANKHLQYMYDGDSLMLMQRKSPKSISIPTVSR